MLLFETWCNNVVAKLATAGLGAAARDLAQPTTDDGLPQVNVFISGDHGTTRSGRSGYADFHHITSLVIEVTDRGSNGETLKGLMFAHAETVLQTLLADWSWGAGLIEGFAGVRQAYMQQPEGQAYTGKVQVQIDVQSYSLWTPVATDDFGRMTVAVPGGINGNITVPTV